MQAAKQFGLATLSALVVANMVGAGIFTSSGYSMAALGNPGRVMLAWSLCGIWAICGAVAYGSLVSRLPISGGEYLFLSRLVHPSVGFLAGWISLFAGFTAPIAIAAKGAVEYGLPQISDPQQAAWIAAAFILAVATTQWIGLSLGATLQNAIVAAKLILLGIILIWAFGFTSADAWSGGPLEGRSPSTLPQDIASWTALVASMSWVALSYTGFNAAIYVAGEAHDARRRVPLAMLLATCTVTVLYLAMNYLYVYGPAAEQISGQEAVAAIAVKAIGGEHMQLLVRGTVTLAMISSIFAMLIAGPRVYQQMARDGVMPRLLVGQHGTPRAALAIQALLSVLAVFAATLLDLMQYLGLTLSACGGLTILSLLWAWRRLPDAPKLKWWELAAVVVYLAITTAILIAARSQQLEKFNAMLITFGLGIIVYCVAIGIPKLLPPPKP